MTRVLLRRIVCAVDRSERATAVIARALVLARLHGAEVLVLHVTDEPRLPAGSVQQSDADPFSDLRPLAHDPSGRVPVRWIVAHGDPATEVARHVRTAQADLVVLGPSWPEPVTGVIGTMADTVLRTAECPVLVTPRAAQVDTPSEPFREILCGVSSGLSMTTLRHALSLAQEFESRLTILNVEYGDGERGDYAWIRSDIDHLRATIPETAEEWCDIEEFVVAGDPATELTRAADRLDADLVVVGAPVAPAFDQDPGRAAALGPFALSRAHVLIVPTPVALSGGAAAPRAVRA